jgi:hypothetical protein
MAKLELFPLSAWVRFFSGSSARTLDRIQEAIEAIDNDDYSPARFLSDTIHFWNETTMGWWSALQESATSGSVPTLFASITPNVQSYPQASAAVNLRGSGPIEMTEILRLGGPPPEPKRGVPQDKLEKHHLQVHPNAAKTRLNLSFVGLQRPDETRSLDEQPNFAPGLYQSMVHRNGKLLAQVVILVEPKPEPKPQAAPKAKARARARARARKKAGKPAKKA